MGCFRINSRDSAENSLQSLRAILATKQPPLSSPWTAKKIIQRKLGFFITRKTLQARTRLLDTASHSLAKAKQRTLISLPPSDNNINSDTSLFPLPLPPGYSSNTNININYLNSSSNHSRASPNPSLHSDSITSCHSSASDSFTPSSSTSSSVFSSAPSSSSSNSSDLRCSSLSHTVDDHSFSIPLPLPSPNKVYAAYLLREFPPHELARACENFNESHKLRDGAMGPVYRAILPTNAEETSSVAIARVTTNISRKKWKAQVQSLARVTHPNLCRIIGFSYERAKYGECNGGNAGFIVYENPGNESLDEFLQDVEKGHSHIDWSTRLKIAIGAAEGLAFLLERMPKQIMYGNFKIDNIQVDSLFNAKLSDMVVTWASDQHKDISAFDVVRGFGLVLLQLFNFSSYPQDREPLDLEVNPQIKQPYPPKDAKLVIDLAASCLLPEAFLRPSMRHVARALRSLEPSPRHVPKFASKSLTHKKRRSFSFS